MSIEDVVNGLKAGLGEDLRCLRANELRQPISRAIKQALQNERGLDAMTLCAAMTFLLAHYITNYFPADQHERRAQELADLLLRSVAELSERKP